MKRLWNIPNYTVYSLATINQENIGNMNICTYVSPYSIKPKLYMIGVYLNTKTLSNLENYPYANLQYLSLDNLDLVRRFGYKSGNKVNKLQKLSDRIEYAQNQIPYLKDCVGYIELKLESINDFSGDHKVCIFSVIKSVLLNPGKELLSISDLQKKNIIKV